MRGITPRTTHQPRELSSPYLFAHCLVQGGAIDDGSWFAWRHGWLTTLAPVALVPDVKSVDPHGTSEGTTRLLVRLATLTGEVVCVRSDRALSADMAGMVPEFPVPSSTDASPISPSMLLTAPGSRQVRLSLTLTQSSIPGHAVELNRSRV
jgi:hypothetical protein